MRHYVCEHVNVCVRFHLLFAFRAYANFSHCTQYTHNNFNQKNEIIIIKYFVFLFRSFASSFVRSFVVIIKRLAVHIKEVFGAAENRPY